jgi:drug/metabolite transporter (DMT)-like permease
VGKYVSDEKSEPVFIGIISAFFTTIVTFLVASQVPMIVPTSVWALAGLVASAAFVAIGIITYYEGLKHSDISEFGLLSRSKTLLMVIAGVVLFRERFTFLQVIGAVFILYSVFVLSWEGGKFKFGKGAKFALATSLLFSVGFVFDKAVISYYSAIMYTFLLYLLTTAFLLPLAFSRVLDGVKMPNIKTIGLQFVAGVMYGVSAYCIYAAFLVNGPISFVTLASQLEIPITILWGIFMLKEKRRVLPKLASMALLIVGIILLR